MGPYQIANKLKEEKVLIPSAYLAQFNEGVNKSKTFKDPCCWGSSTICNILDKREYLGHTVNFKTRKHFKDKKSHYVPEDEWLIFENTHEAIIDQETLVSLLFPHSPRGNDYLLRSGADHEAGGNQHL